MKRKIFSLNILILQLAILGGTMFPLFSFAAEEEKKPNIILILADDMDPYLFTPEAVELYGPNFKKYIFNESAVFNNFVVSTPLCGPSRAALLTGRFAHNTTMMGNRSGTTAADGTRIGGGYREFYSLGLDQTNIGVQMQEAGYYTSYVGKYHHEESPNQVAPDKKAFGWNDQRFSHGGIYFNTWRTINGKGKQNPADEHRTDVEADEAVEILGNIDGQDKPFFMVLAPFSVHNSSDGSLIYPSRYADFFKNEIPPQFKTASFNETDNSDKSTHINQVPQMSETLKAYLVKMHQSRLRGMKTFDDMIGDVFKKLEATGQLDNTYVFFTSDNGFLLGEHRLTAKQYPYSESTTYPLLVRGPGVIKREVDHIVSMQDLFPTFLNLAKKQPRTPVDGRSLRLLLLKKQIPPLENWRQYALVEHWETRSEHQNAITVNAEYRALRAVNYSYTEWYDGQKEYYNLVSDPMELNNVYNSLTETRKKSLANQLGKLATCDASTFNNPCRPTIKVTGPQTKSAYEVGTVIPIRWETKQFGKEKIRIVLGKNGLGVIMTIVTGTANDGSYDWQVPAEVADGNGYFIRVISQDDVTVWDNVREIRIINPDTTVTTKISNLVETLGALVTSMYDRAKQ